MARELSLKQTAELLPEQVLGLYTQNDAPLNLIWRPLSVSDPRCKILLQEEWSLVRGAEGALSAPATLEAYRQLADTDIEIKISKRALDWLEHATGERRTEIRFTDRCPLFPYQKEAVEFLFSRKRAMLSLSPGLGKTLTSAYAAGMVQARSVLLVCPASLLYYWKSELERWEGTLPFRPTSVVWHRETPPLPEVLEKGEQLWVLTNPETLTRKSEAFLRENWDMLLVDESIMYKHRTSQRSNKLKRIARKIPWVWLLTGAPATRYLDDMWHQFHILKPSGYSSYWRFAERYCVVEENQWAKQVVSNKRDAEYEIKRNFQDIYFTRSQDEVTDIPEWLFEDIDLQMPKKQDRIYNKLREELLIELSPFSDGEVLRIKSHLSLMLRSLQVLSNPLLVGSEDVSGKWDALPELMEIYPGPYIVWVNFIKTGELLLERLGKEGRFEGKVALVNGATKMEQRNEIVQEFQRGTYDVIVMNNAVGKFGFNLTRARTSFFVERMYDDSMFQCLHRNRRIGTTEAPVVVNMRSITQDGRRTVDHVVHDTLDYRTGMIRKLTVGELRKVLSK